MPDYRINISDSDYPDPYDEEPKRKFHYRPIPNYLREYVKWEKLSKKEVANV